MTDDQSIESDKRLYPSSWVGAKEIYLEESLRATPAQRLAWLEEAMKLAWLAGANGVKFGLIMPGKPTLGDKFYLEMAPGAVERVEIVKLDAKLETPLRSFSQVVHCREYDVVDGDSSQKWYAAGIGMVGDDEMRAVKIEQPAP